MKSIALLALLSAFIYAMPSRAQDGAADARIGSIDYVPDQISTLEVQSSVGLILAFRPAERIRTVKLSARDSYEIVVAPDATSLALRQNRPVEQVVMSVDTDFGHYDFRLRPATDPSAPLVVRIRYPEQQSGIATSALTPDKPSALPNQYRLTGAKNLRPQSVSDDGDRMYVTWGEEQAVSAVFAIDETGREQMVDGYMRDGVYTIDRVYEALVFRIDKSVAKAVRPKLRVKSHD